MRAEGHGYAGAGCLGRCSKGNRPAAIAHALDCTGWKMQEGGRKFLDNHGEELDLEFGSTAMLKRYVRRRLVEMRTSAIEKRANKRGIVDEAVSIDWEPVISFLRGKRPKNETRRVMQALWGVYPTGVYLSEHGFEVESIA